MLKRLFSFIDSEKNDNGFAKIFNEDGNRQIEYFLKYYKNGVLSFFEFSEFLSKYPVYCPKTKKFIQRNPLDYC